MTVNATSWERGSVRRFLLWCGVLAALLYMATDVIGGLAYPGYSFSSQAVSELMAVGAPSERIVDPLFLVNGLLGVAFAIGVLLEKKGRALRIAGVLLLLNALIGFTGPTLFEMHPRGVGNVQSDTPHIVLTGIGIVLMLGAIGFGGFALGARFRVYSVATIALVLGLSAAMVPFAARLGAGQPTPGMGIVERVLIYAGWSLWPAMLAVALLRRGRSASPTRATTTAPIHGFVAPGFEEVRTEFERNFAERGEIGAAVAAYWYGEKVVDLWGGYRTPARDLPWETDTMVPVMSSTKGFSALTLAVASARGWLEYDAPVARYWPEFAQHGKGAITVRQLLGHEAGLVLLDETLTLEKMRDLDGLARILARQKPAWLPGTRHGYHTMTIGLYMQELMRRVDPAHRTLGRVFREEIALPLGAEFYIGLPREIPSSRIALLQTLSRTRALGALHVVPLPTLMRMIFPGTLLRRSMLLAHLDMNDRASLEIELPAGNGVGTARAMARIYSALADGGAEVGITPETFARITTPPPRLRHKDVVLGVPSYFSLGFLRPGPQLWFGSSQRALGSPGAGGSFAFADPTARLGYAYVMNRMNFHLENDPREKSLRDAIYRAMKRSLVREGTGKLPAASEAAMAGR